MSEAVLVLAWLVLAHFVADFVLQTGGIAQAKADRGSRALGGLLAHGLIVAACLIPVGLAFGGPGWAFLAVTAVSHAVIDWTKVVVTRRSADAALRDAASRHEGPAAADHLGRAWTPAPAAWFVADQAAHLLIAGLAWAVFLAGTATTAGWVSAVDGALGGWDRAAVHRVLGVAVVVASLLIVNLRAASLFVAILVRPVEEGLDGRHRWGGRASRPAAATRAAASPPPAGGKRWSIRLGPLEALVASEETPAGAEAIPGTDAQPVALTARVGATIGVLERLLVLVFVLTGTDVAIGFVVAAKTLARFKQLDDREFAEYYLLGTLGSVGVAIVTALVGRAALTALLA